MKLHSAKSYHRISVSLIFLIPLLFLITMYPVASQETKYATVRIVNPLTGSSKFILHATEYPINSTITVDFYITEAINTYGWQFYIKWNNSVINYQKAWIPDDNMLKEAVDSGAELIKVPPAVEIEGDTGYLKYGATALYTGNDPPFYPINITEPKLLCKVNFTVAVSPGEGEYYTTNIFIIKMISGSGESLDSFVFVYPSTEKKEIKAEPAVVWILGLNAVPPITQDIAATNVVLSTSKIYVGEYLNMTAYFKNYGNDLESFNFTISVGDMQLVRSYMTLPPGEEDHFIYNWPVPENMHTGKYNLTVYVEPLEFETETANNLYILTINIEKNLVGFEYAMWLFSVWFSTPLGMFFIIYLVLAVGLFSTLAIMRRIRR